VHLPFVVQPAAGQLPGAAGARGTVAGPEPGLAPPVCAQQQQRKTAAGLYFEENQLGPSGGPTEQSNPPSLSFEDTISEMPSKSLLEEITGIIPNLSHT
jgi:hypothetical protein